MCKTTGQIKSKSQITLILYSLSNICKLLLRVNASLVIPDTHFKLLSQEAAQEE
jgi:hypothetical protein